MNPSELIARIRKGRASRDEVMKELYDNAKLLENCVKFVKAKGGNVEDANTVFTEAIVNFVKNCYRPEFKIHSTVENYFFGVTRNLWFRTLRERKKNASTDKLPPSVDEEDPEILLVNTERRDRLTEILDKLDPKCRQVLILWSQNLKMKSIAEEMNYSSPEVVRKKKHFCLKKLIALVHQHPSYLELLRS